ncbi:MAG: DNA polymerase III subunit delta' [Gammaproteobacteria bacterium]|nr:DNA polymerase III subunit delta' [Gammaproteobacteria bacterium]
MTRGQFDLPDWLIPNWTRLQQMLAQQRLPHGLVLGGLPGLGKRQLAETLLARLLCQQPHQGVACEECKSCLLRHSQNHPDIKILQPEEEGKAILVDSVRKLQPWLAATAQQGGAKVVLVEPANELNINAANALLKNLEEPGSNTYFILLHHWPRPLLATIKSRCQAQEILPPHEKLGLRWLQLQSSTAINEELRQVMTMAHGAPLLALRYLQQGAHATRHQTLVDLTALLRNKASVAEVAENWAKGPVRQVLDWWLQWLQDLIKLKQTADVANIRNQDVEKLLLAVAKKTSIEAMFALYDEVLQALDSINKRRNINQQLMLEQLLYRWYQLL